MPFLCFVFGVNLPSLALLIIDPLIGKLASLSLTGQFSLVTVILHQELAYSLAYP